MPARKPAALNRRHSTRAEKDARDDTERAMRPRTAISVRPPAKIAKNPDAAKTWKRVIGLYMETEATLVTAFDQDLLARYCLAEAELVELQKIRKDVKREWERHRVLLLQVKPRTEEVKAYYAALSEANALLQRYTAMDARVDAKRKMLLGMEQSLYLTPRSRAAVAMAERVRAEAKDEMEQLLDD